MPIQSFYDFDLFVVPERITPSNRITGSGQKGVIILFESEEDNPELISFLSKILSAVQLELAKDANLIHLKASEGINFSGLCQQKDVAYLLSFGISPQRLGLQLNYQKYIPFQFKECQFLFADQLPLIFEERQEGGKKMSGALWKALQALFLKSGK